MHVPIQAVSKSVRPGINFNYAHFRQLLLMRCSSTVASASAHVNGNAEEHHHSSDSNGVEYPFPKHPHPTPHEIFHLKPSARQSEIKSRYYQLVRIHHPDAPHARRLPSHVSHARFQAIQAAHDVLIGKMRRSDFQSHTHHSHTTHSATSRGHTAHSHAHRRPHHLYAEWSHAAEEAEANADDKGKENPMLIIAIIGGIGLATIPFFTNAPNADKKHQKAVQNLAQARKDAKEFGMIRRREIRKRVRSNELEREYEQKLLSDGNESKVDLG